MKKVFLPIALFLVTLAFTQCTQDDEEISPKITNETQLTQGNDLVIRKKPGGTSTTSTAKHGNDKVVR